MQPPPPHNDTLQIEHRSRGPAVIVRAVGGVDTDTAPLLIQHLTLAAQQATPPGPVVVDLREIHMFGFRGIAALTKIHHQCQLWHLDLRVLANSAVARILQVSGADKALTICPTLTEALQTGMLDEQTPN